MNIGSYSRLSDLRTPRTQSESMRLAKWDRPAWWRIYLVDIATAAVLVVIGVVGYWSLPG